MHNDFKPSGLAGMCKLIAISIGILLIVNSSVPDKLASMSGLPFLSATCSNAASRYEAQIAPEAVSVNDFDPYELTQEAACRYSHSAQSTGDALAHDIGQLAEKAVRAIKRAYRAVSPFQ